MNTKQKGLGSRFLKFQSVGLMGILVQLAALAMLKEFLNLDTTLAAGLAVETAILHNFLWHERWTWRAQTGTRSLAAIVRLLWRFHLGAGGISLLTNLGLTETLADTLHIHYLVANLLAIGCAGITNFLVSEYLVFRSGAQ